MDTTKRDGEPDQVVNISRDGDVILIVGAENVRLRVQSQCLRSASKTFSAMFGPRWSEGQRLSKGSPTEVPLPEDDADAMRTICCIVHHRNDLVSQHLTAKEILRIAIGVDKYDLKIALKYASVEWLKPRVNAEREEMGHLLAAAFLFDNTDAFMAHTITLILRYNGSYLDFLDDDFTSQIIPSRVFSLLEERRTRFRAELCDLLIRGKKDGCKCGWGKTRGEKYGRLLAAYMPIKMLDTSMADIITKMEQMSTEDMGRKFCTEKRSSGRYYHGPLPYRQTLLGMLDAMKKRASICIDCVRSIGATEL
ncbi:hypothetical protein DM02DRAFT_664040 [Periconia macrospinosa]|uniref:BTB domain-containing protein n=1 Tax=Periconia macrospinosa TaxID=97972 RepID=A0A2V1D2A0_9PLEO|nr:hypothetical protein DM02DRAFT_664040 [Periconia macrospinosa]